MKLETAPWWVAWLKAAICWSASSGRILSVRLRPWKQHWYCGKLQTWHYIILYHHYILFGIDVFFFSLSLCMILQDSAEVKNLDPELVVRISGWSMWLDHVTVDHSAEPTTSVGMRGPAKSWQSCHWRAKSSIITAPCIQCLYIYIYIYFLVGGFKHFLFSIIYGIILPIDFHIFQDGYCTTNQYHNGLQTSINCTHGASVDQNTHTNITSFGKITTIWRCKHRFDQPQEGKTSLLGEYV